LVGEYRESCFQSRCHQRRLPGSGGPPKDDGAAWAHYRPRVEDAPGAARKEYRRGRLEDVARREARRGVEGGAGGWRVHALSHEVHAREEDVVDANLVDVLSEVPKEARLGQGLGRGSVEDVDRERHRRAPEGFVLRRVPEPVPEREDPRVVRAQEEAV